MQVFFIIFPIVAIVLLGFFYGKLYHPNMDVVNTLTLRVFVPALIFDVLSKGDFQITAYRWLILGGIIVVLGKGVFSWVIAKLMHYPMRAFVPTMMFNNCGNIGLPLVVLTFGDSALETAVVLFLVSNISHFTLGAYIFGRSVSWREVVFSPVNVITVIALMINFMGIQLPDVVLYPITALGQIVIPLMLFSLGVRMLNIEFRYWKMGLVGAFVGPLAGILVTIISSIFLPLDSFQVAVLLLFSSLPPAVLNFLFSEKYRQNRQLVASLVLIGNAMSVIVLYGVLLYLF